MRFEKATGLLAAAAFLMPWTMAGSAMADTTNGDRFQQEWLDETLHNPFVWALVAVILLGLASFIYRSQVSALGAARARRLERVRRTSPLHIRGEVERWEEYARNMESRLPEVTNPRARTKLAREIQRARGKAVQFRASYERVVGLPYPYGDNAANPGDRTR